MQKIYYVYIMSSISKVLYIGVTNNISRRVLEHKSGLSSFTTTYKCYKLVYIETYQNIELALKREKQLKKWSRKKKVHVIEIQNPNWKDIINQWDR